MASLAASVRIKKRADFESARFWGLQLIKLTMRANPWHETKTPRNATARSANHLLLSHEA